MSNNTLFHSEEYIEEKNSIYKPKVINNPQGNILDDYILESDGQLAFRF